MGSVLAMLAAAAVAAAEGTAPDAGPVVRGEPALAGPARSEAPLPAQAGSDAAFAGQGRSEAGFTPSARTDNVEAAPLRTQRGSRPWLELDAGGAALHHSGIRGFASGPQVRFAVGMPVGQGAAVELWAGGTLQSLPHGALGDEGTAGGGLGGRLLLHQFDADGRFQLFARAGAGYMAATTAGAPQGFAGFAGALFMLQPPVKRFAFGLEVDATVIGNAYGLALMPTLRCGL